MTNIRNPDSPQAICLGDVVICDDTARRQAEEYGHSYERELVYLFVHSVLHLLGYDHMDEEERREMRTREENVMRRVRLVQRLKFCWKKRGHAGMKGSEWDEIRFCRNYRQTECGKIDAAECDDRRKGGDHIE